MPPVGLSTRSPQATVGRADLLRLLVLWGEGAENAAAGITGFEYQPPDDDPAKPPPSEAGPEKAPAPPVKDPGTEERLRAVHYSATVSTEDGTGLGDNYLQRLRLDQGGDAELSAFRQTLAPAWVPLVPERRLTVFVERQLRSWQPANQWDVSRIVRQLGRGLPPAKRKARQQKLRWAGTALVIQMARQTEPLHDDYRALAQIAHRRSGGRVPIYLHYAGCGWSVYDPDADRQARRVLPRLWREMTGPPTLEGVSGLAVGWPLSAGIWPEGWRPHALLAAWEPPDAQAPAPAPQDSRTAPATRLPPVACWDVYDRLQTRRQPPASQLCASAQQLSQLLALMSLAVIVHAELLRALRCLLGLPAGAEAQVWAHPDVGCNGVAIAVRAARRSHYIGLVAALPLDLRRQAAVCIEAHHTQFSPEIVLEEAQLAHTHAPGAPVMRPEAHFKRIALGLREDFQTDESAEIRAYLQRAGHRTDQATWEGSPEFALAWGMANPQVLETPEDLPAHFPIGLLPALRAALGGLPIANPAQGLRLRQQDGFLTLERYAATTLLEAAPRPANVLAQWESAAVLQWRSGERQPWKRLSMNQAMLRIDLAELAPIELTDGRVTCVVAAERRPPWALEWARDPQGLYALAPNPWRKPLRVPYPRHTKESPHPLFLMKEAAGQGGRKADAFALDLDDYGLLATLTLNHPHGQAFRYLPPGRFLMGSPGTEPERQPNEGPQHWVTLTEGLWLADTACTQGLWQAVMGGKNPSHFKGAADLPVEQVDWDDVQAFLRQLQAYLPAGLEAVLPTEAEWEYACRAGSAASTPFSFGEQIGTGQANYDGNYPYNGGPKGEYRRTTVAVKALPANAWGLYQMHGNVWEWCADDRRSYTAEAVSDPSGARGEDVAYRALRGGSWDSDARNARSAQRDRWPRDFGCRYAGFRFALRSTSQAGAGGPVPPGRSPQEARDGPGFGAAAPAREKTVPNQGGARDALPDWIKRPER